MGYRDDQDAALARADALQVELDRSRKELERARSTLAQREADLAASEQERETLAARVPAAPTASASAEPLPSAKPGLHPAIIIGIVALGFAGIVALVASVKAAKEREQAEQQKQLDRYLKHADIGAGTLRSCTLRTVPSGAEVVSVDGAGTAFSMGMTPFSRSIGSWSITGEHLEARLDGYQPVTLTEPGMDWSTSTCEATITLVPLSGR